MSIMPSRYVPNWLASYLRCVAQSLLIVSLLHIWLTNRAILAQSPPPTPDADNPPARVRTMEATVPQPLPGWKMELVLQAPDVVHPSVVACAPDGRVFVAEDPMDIRAMPASAQHGRILCLHPDGRRTVYQDGLYAVFGMQYVDGYLYVLHNPVFSRFKDGGDVAGERVDLIKSTLPEPWAQDWNDHVPANFKLGMDGLFYVAVGDKGLYQCRGTDGSEVNLHGGGILRLNPSGGQLEVLCSGVRNIMDVALLSDDDVFTYDNTDEQQWMSRLTHMIEGGFYGYPFDFIPRRDYTLWPLADYGGGAATGALAYTEAAWGKDFLDNLFLADFGKRNILRVKVTPKDGTFVEAMREDLFPNPPADFRPVGIAVSFDGTTLFVCDWNHTDTKEDVPVGRLWKLTRDQNVVSVDIPEWCIRAAQGQDFEAADETLIEAFDHRAKQVRGTAQRRLSERGQQVADRLMRVLTDSAASENARIHALWALHAMDPRRSMHDELLSVIKTPPPPRLARQIVRRQGLARIKGSNAILSIAMESSDAAVVREAIIAVGRLAGDSKVDFVSQWLADDRLFLRHSSVAAVRRCLAANPNSWRSVIEILTSKRLDALEEQSLLAVMRDNYDVNLIHELQGAVNSPSSSDETSAKKARLFPVMASLAFKAPEWKGEWWSYHPVNKSPPKKTLRWEGSAFVEQTILKSLSTHDRAIQLAAIKAAADINLVDAVDDIRSMANSATDETKLLAALQALGQLKDKQSEGVIARWINGNAASDAVQRLAIATGSKIGGNEVKAALRLLLAQQEKMDVWGDAAEALVLLHDESAAASITTALESSLRSADQQGAEALAESLAKLPGDHVSSTLGKILDSHIALNIKRSALRGMRSGQGKAPFATLARLYAQPELRDDAALTLISKPSVDATSIYLELLTDRQAALRDGAAEALRTLKAEVKYTIEAQANLLPAQTVFRLRDIYAGDEAMKASPLFTRELTGVLTPADYERFALENKGDAARGKSVFLDERGAGCHKCHSNQHAAVLTDPLGPDLSAVGSQFSRSQLIEHVLHPSKSVREGYQAWNISTTSGEVFVGLPRGERDGQLLLVDRERRMHEIPLAEIEERVPGDVSLMPADLQQGLSLEGFADLIAFLESCRAANSNRDGATSGAPEGFTSLFNGRDLTGWSQDSKVRAHWRVQDGSLYHDGVAEDIWTDDRFGNFTLWIDWRFPGPTAWQDHPLIDLEGEPVVDAEGNPVTERTLDAGDSGVFLRGYRKAQANLFCYPIGSGEVWEYRTDPAMSAEVRKGVTPSQRADRPVGEWNHMEITMLGDRMTVALNGVEVIDNAKLPGVPPSGPIGLQHEHGPLEFRNIYIKRLD